MDCIHDGRSDDFDVLKQGWIQHDLVGGGGGALSALVPSCDGYVCRPPSNLLDYCKILLDYCI